MLRAPQLYCFLAFLLPVQIPSGDSKVVAQVPAEFSQLDVSIVTSQQWEDAAVRAAPLLIHFHGAAATTAENFHQAKVPGVLVTVNCRGLSSAYRKPFENEKLFPYLLADVKRKLVADGRLRSNGAFGSLGLSCFSAGYGAVREILKSAAAVKQVDSLVAADSIYASIHIQGSRRVVDAEQMEPFLNFARLAARKEKSFLLSHSQLPVEPYASTVETADYLLKELGGSKAPIESPNKDAFSPIATARLGSFTVESYSGSTGESHLAHLRNIAQLWKTIHNMK